MDQENDKLIKTLRQLAQAESDCRTCQLYRDATRVVPGEAARLAAGKAAAAKR